MNNDWVNDYLMHHGILGQKWGVRRYQNKDGSLTPRGRKRYYDENNILTDKGRKAYYDRDNELNYEGRKALNNARVSARLKAYDGDVEGAIQSYKDVGSLRGRVYSEAGEAVLEDRERNAKQVVNELKSYLDYLGEWDRNDYIGIVDILDDESYHKVMNESIDTYKKIYDSLDDNHRHEKLKYAGEKERKALARIKALENAASKQFAEMESRVSKYERTHSKEALAPQKEESLRKAREKGVFDEDFEWGVGSSFMYWTDDRKLREYEKYYDMGGLAYFKDLYKGRLNRTYK